ncbi:Os01g0871150 [Oryza sativa Japonica Group]|uniref:Os01g0871150 protein n=1 Tax=Oryza sativa subsp. japonica TaxID=39947 RepID=A0A0P0VAY8_ORYSJ|nr:Os01g0871150 [Oryza sativa Japonica Group]
MKLTNVVFLYLLSCRLFRALGRHCIYFCDIFIIYFPGVFILLRKIPIILFYVINLVRRGDIITRAIICHRSYHSIFHDVDIWALIDGRLQGRTQNMVLCLQFNYDMKQQSNHHFKMHAPYHSLPAVSP